MVRPAQGETATGVGFSKSFATSVITQKGSFLVTSSAKSVRRYTAKQEPTRGTVTITG
jgi:hypothetical protein